MQQFTVGWPICGSSGSDRGHEQMNNGEENRAINISTVETGYKVALLTIKPTTQIFSKVILGLYSQLHLLATPSVRGGRPKLLVDDLSSPMFRHKLVQEQFVQWNWHQVRGDTYMTSAKFWDFWTPPPCHVQNSRNLLFSHLFFGDSPLPHPVWTSFKVCPLRHL